MELQTLLIFLGLSAFFYVLFTEDDEKKKGKNTAKNTQNKSKKPSGVNRAKPKNQTGNTRRTLDKDLLIPLFKNMKSNISKC